MKQPEIVSLLVRKDERIAKLEEENRKLREVLGLGLKAINALAYGDNFKNLNETISKIEDTLNEQNSSRE